LRRRFSFAAANRRFCGITPDTYTCLCAGVLKKSGGRILQLPTLGAAPLLGPSEYDFSWIFLPQVVGWMVTPMARITDSRWVTFTVTDTGTDFIDQIAVLTGS
jgi:hypothetical protein